MTKGIHHITAIASDAAETVHFYTEVLGLRLVKKSVNQDDVSAYHLFFGDRVGHPGMDLTFFIFQPAVQGRRGHGLVTEIALAVPEGSLEFWEERLKARKVKCEEARAQFGTQRLVFFDGDDQQLSLVGVPERHLDPAADPWTTTEIDAAHAIRSFYGAGLSVTSLSMIAPILTDVFGYVQTATAGNMHEFALTDSRRARMLEVHELPSASAGFNAAGTVHHIAFRAENIEAQAAMRARVEKLRLSPTDVIDRYYFKSVYFMTPSGILFEIATDGPGFTADEPEGTLGARLALPPFLEGHRQAIEAHLPPLVL